MREEEVQRINKAGWDVIADKWFGSTALPNFAPLMPTEEELNVFGEIQDKTLLDIGCGSGHSLSYMGEKGASELWGVDISATQINNAKKYLEENEYSHKLFRSPMEENPGIPTDYFDIVYSIYAFGWTTNLEKSIGLVSSYLKKGGMFVFSWDHPITPCLSTSNNNIIVSKSYHDEDYVSLSKDNQEMKLKQRKLSSYINTMRKSGLIVDRIIEDVNEDILSEEHSDIDRYYSKYKAKYLPLSIIIKAIKE